MFVQDGKLNLVVRQQGKDYTATTNQPLPEKFDFVGQVAANGALTLSIDGKPAAQAKAPSMFKKPLDMGLRTGQDVENENRMGPYTGTFVLTGNIQNTTLELKRPTSAAGNATATKNKTTVSKANAAAAKVLAPVTINVKVVEHLMQFDKKQITIKAGQKVTLNLDNPDGMQHNLVIIKPGTLQKVGAAADQLARDPNGADKSYVPRMPEVLFATKLVNTGESYTLEFTAPTQPGDYVFVCTFPGHWRGMNGILRIEK
jgi:azurin